VPILGPARDKPTSRSIEGMEKKAENVQCEHFILLSHCIHMFRFYVSFDILAVSSTARGLSVEVSMYDIMITSAWSFPVNVFHVVDYSTI
jgi:hypothetical protein